MLNYLFTGADISRFDVFAVAVFAYAFGAEQLNGWMYIVGLLATATFSVLVQEMMR